MEDRALSLASCVQNLSTLQSSALAAFCDEEAVNQLKAATRMVGALVVGEGPQMPNPTPFLKQVPSSVVWQEPVLLRLKHPIKT